MSIECESIHRKNNLRKKQETNMKPTDKIALITGASRGLGRNTAMNLARNGTDVILTYHSNQKEADSAVAEIGALGQKAVAIQLDTGNIGAFDGFVDSVRQALAGLGTERFDYLVNNAGTAHHNSIEKTTEAEMDALCTVHFKGVFFLTQKLLPLINDDGRILMISSGLTGSSSRKAPRMRP